MAANPIAAIWQGIALGLIPDKLSQSIDEWADANRILDSSSAAEPGRYRTERTPYLKDIMRALSPSDPVQEVVFMKGSQIGATEIGLNWLGYIIDVCAAPVLVVQPTGDLIKRFVKQRLDPAIASSPSLARKMAETKTRDGANTMFIKSFAGGFMILTGANSSSGLRSAPVRFIFMDEVDDYPRDINQQGDVVKLAEARTRTFRRNRKIFIPSTPTVKGSSRIESLFEHSSQDYFYLPCQHCGHYQTLKFNSLKWQKGKYDTVHYICEACGVAIEETDKPVMLAAGEWRSNKPHIKYRRGFHLSALYSPLGWYSWSDLAKEFEEAQADIEQLKTFVNTVLGEVWEDKGEVPDWEEIYERKDNYQAGIIPTGGLFLTAGADVQKDRIEIEVTAWGRNKESWSIDYQVIAGDTTKPDVWDSFRQFLQGKMYPHESGTTLPIRMTAIDSGNNTQIVYNFVRELNDPNVIAVKGMDNKQASSVFMVGQPKQVDIKQEGQKIIYRGVKFWPVHVALIKDELYAYLRRKKKKDDEVYPPGYCHFPDAYDKEYFRQLCSEQKISKMVGSRSVMYWQKIYERNEALDCRIYSRAAAFIVGIDRFEDAHWKQIEDYITNNAGEIKNGGYNKKQGGVKIVKSDFW